MSVILMDFGVGMARLRSVAIFLTEFLYYPQMKSREQLDLGLPRE